MTQEQINESNKQTPKLIGQFADWLCGMKSEKRGDKIMYDIPGHYKWVDITQAFDLYLSGNYEQEERK